MSQEHKEMRSLVSFKDVQIAYLLEGINGIDKMTKGRRNASSLLRKALKELKISGRKVDSLENYILRNYGPGKRGRSVPVCGQDRLYRAQRLKTGGAFLRLPLGSMGTGKGGIVKVRFDKDKITVEKA